METRSPSRRAPKARTGAATRPVINIIRRRSRGYTSRMKRQGKSGRSKKREDPVFKKPATWP